MEIAGFKDRTKERRLCNCSLIKLHNTYVMYATKIYDKTMHICSKELSEKLTFHELILN